MNKNENVKRTTIRLTKEMHADFKKFCIENETSMTDYLISCIEKALEKEKFLSDEKKSG